MSDPNLPYLRILLLEAANETPEVADALRALVPDATVLRLEAEAPFERALDEFAPDVILCHEPVTGGLSALDALRVTQARRPEAPLLLVARAFGEMSSEALRAGAADFVATADLTRLRPAIAAALKRREALRKLTKRQREVLQLIAAGSSTREVARRLRLSVKTVETHRAQVMKRLDIHDLASLVRYAVRVGIVSAAQ
jgi:DNA-binding NarL/FixJ family response regulator